MLCWTLGLTQWPKAGLSESLALHWHSTVCRLYRHFEATCHRAFEDEKTRSHVAKSPLPLTMQLVKVHPRELMSRPATTVCPHHHRR